MPPSSKATSVKTAGRSTTAVASVDAKGAAMIDARKDTKKDTIKDTIKDTRTLRERYEDVRARVAAAAVRSGRKPSDVMLVAVTKNASIEHIRELVLLGHVDFGENRVQQLVQRAAIIDEFNTRRTERGERPTAVRWHMIGSLQRNKVRQAMDTAKLVHSVDSLRLAEELQDFAEERGVASPEAGPVDVLVEVNVAGERSKHGVAPAAARHLVEMIESMVALQPRGLMCMAPNSTDPARKAADAHRIFTRCKELFDEIRLLQVGGTRFDILSMGMSEDFEIAIECGANLVRVGSAIFGEPLAGEQDDVAEVSADE